jgi:uncharacterized protein (TIGR02611 family)
MTIKSLKRIFIAIAGSTVLLIGIVMIFLPGPSILVIPAGLGILATEFVWAKVLLNKMKEKIFRKKTFMKSDTPDDVK